MCTSQIYIAELTKEKICSIFRTKAIASFQFKCRKTCMFYLELSDTLTTCRQIDGPRPSNYGSPRRARLILLYSSSLCTSGITSLTPSSVWMATGCTHRVSPKCSLSRYGEFILSLSPLTVSDIDSCPSLYSSGLGWVTDTRRVLRTR